MKLSLFIVLTGVLAMVALAISAETDSNLVEVTVLTEQNWDEYVPEGKEVDAIYGDIVLRNKNVIAVIARPVATRNANMTVRNVGGCLLDLTSREFESDQLSCFYPGGTDYAYRDVSSTVGDEAPRKLTDNKVLTGKSGEVTVTAKGAGGRPTVMTSYRLNESSTSLEISTEYRNDLKKNITVVPMDYIRADGKSTEMVKTPNGTTDQYSITDEYWQQAYLLTADEQIQSNSNSRSSTLKYITKAGADFKSLAPESSATLTRHLAVGTTYLDALQAAKAGKFQKGSVTLSDENGNAIDHGVLRVKQNGNSLGVIRADQNGKAVSAFPMGSCNLEVFHHGQKIASVTEFKSDVLNDELNVDLSVSDYSPGTLKLKIRDQVGKPLPSKVEITGLDGTPTPDFGPETAEFAVKNLRYTPNGSVEQSLAPGKYLIRTSHGPEYSSEEKEIEIKANETTSIAAILERMVNTTGWVSTDFHSHSTPSGDNTSSQKGRVLNLVCENIEFAPCTEHNRIDTYQQHIEELKIQPFMSSVSGMELTGSPLPLNHQNVFPLHHHPHRQDGGGPVTDGSVETQIRRLATWDDNSEKLIQQDHPDVGWLFYDKNGDGKPDGGHADGTPFIDAMEIHPIPRALETGALDGVTEAKAKKNRVFKWLQLLNQGYRIPGVVNTDAHYNFHGSGWIRNWVQCSTDDPAKIDHMEIVHASEEGRIVMSNGPFLKMEAANSKGIIADVGQDLESGGAPVVVNISVQCPNWHRVNKVFLLKNGRPSEELTFTKESNSELFKLIGEEDRQKQTFNLNLTLKLEADTHIVAVAGGVGNKIGPVSGPRFGNDPPTALTNPIYIDVDGNGFTPNKDTLGRPLPVKGD